MTPIVVGDDALAMRHVNGVFKIGDEAAFLGALEKGLRVPPAHNVIGTLLTESDGHSRCNGRPHAAGANDTIDRIITQGAR